MQFVCDPHASTAICESNHLRAWERESGIGASPLRPEHSPLNKSLCSDLSSVKPVLDPRVHVENDHGQFEQDAQTHRPALQRDARAALARHR